MTLFHNTPTGKLKKQLRSSLSSECYLWILVVTVAIFGSGVAEAQDRKFSLPKNPFRKNENDLKETGQAPSGPGAMCILPSGETIISCHQFFNPQYRVMKLTKKGEWEPFPNLQMNVRGGGAAVELDSVIGVACDSRGIVWMLDNGRRSETSPKLVAWDTKKDDLHRQIVITAVTPASFLTNLVLDPVAPFIYLADPADGVRSAIVVVNLETGIARRVLQGHYSVRRDPTVEIELDGTLLEVRRPDGQIATPLTGVSPIAIDRKGEWLYYGPRNGASLFKISAALLRQRDISATSLQSQVTGVSPKPICDSMAIDSKGRIYFGDISRGSIDYVSPDEQYLNLRLHVMDPRMIWPGGLIIGPGGKLHFFSSQLHRAPFFHDGKDNTLPPYYLFEARPLPTSRFGF